MTDVWTEVQPASCAHIAAYYHQRWEAHKCIAFNLLRRGYLQWAQGKVESLNNLYDILERYP